METDKFTGAGVVTFDKKTDSFLARIAKAGTVSVQGGRSGVGVYLIIYVIAPYRRRTPGRAGRKEQAVNFFEKGGNKAV